MNKSSESTFDMAARFAAFSTGTPPVRMQRTGERGRIREGRSRAAHDSRQHAAGVGHRIVQFAAVPDQDKQSVAHDRS